MGSVWSKRASDLCLFAVGLINFVPVVGLLPNRVAQLYELESVDNVNVDVMLRHRALLFGIVGALTVASVWKRHLRATGYIASLASMVGYVALAAQNPVNAALAKVSRVDQFALALLIVSYILERKSQSI
jgi:hypothetical protein